MNLTQEPERTCVGCRGKGARSALLRIVLDADSAALVFDANKSMPGRGAWLHADAECLTKATTRKAWSRAFKMRCSVKTDSVHRALTERLSATSPLGGTQQESHVVVPHDHDRKRV